MSELEQLRIENLRLREALEKYIAAGFGDTTDYVKQGEAYDAAIEALNATPANDEWLDKLVMERLGEPVAWITKDATDDLEHQGSAVCYASDIPEIHMEPLYRLTSGKEGK